MGCYSSEVAFGEDRSYGGGASGAFVKLAQHDAKQRDLPYYALSRNGQDGHSFSFSTLPNERFKVNSKGCLRPCLDLKDKACGCMDQSCVDSGDFPIAPEENNRRWVVYARA